MADSGAKGAVSLTERSPTSLADKVQVHEESQVTFHEVRGELLEHGNRDNIVVLLVAQVHHALANCVRKSVKTNRGRGNTHQLFPNLLHHVKKCLEVEPVRPLDGENLFE
jgi:hypothetical protein